MLIKYKLTVYSSEGSEGPFEKLVHLLLYHIWS